MGQRVMRSSRRLGRVRTTATVLALTLAFPLGAREARADAIRRAGDIGAVLLPVGAATGALIIKDHKGLEQLAWAYGSTMAVVFVLKPLVNRTRPDGGSQSFPSGHSASAFAGAGFLQMRYGWKLGAPAYALAAFVGYSRVESKRHYTSDVVAGAALGIGANLIFTRPREHVAVSLDMGRGHAGASVTLSW
jgi:membrane-associated phospholipid phosphatase